jgi:hypothetical protein
MVNGEQRPAGAPNLTPAGRPMVRVSDVLNNEAAT